MKLTLAQISERLDGVCDGDGTRFIYGVAPFETANEKQITYAAGAGFLKRLGQTQAGAILVPTKCKERAAHLIRVDNPQACFARLASLFHPPVRPDWGISTKAEIADSARIQADPAVGPFAVIGPGVKLGARATIHPHVTIGADVVIGDDVVIHPHVAIYSGCRIGSRVTIHAGTVIGSDGFGFAPDGEQYVKIPHLGTVQIDDDVEIGAGNTIDRATFGKTWIQRGTKTDNLVHVAHNVTVGEDSVLVAQVGISGSVTIGKRVIIAGQSGVAGHLKIGDGVMVGAQSGIGQSVEDGKIVSGSPAMNHRQWLRVQNTVPRLPELKRRIEALEKKLHAQESAKAE